MNPLINSRTMFAYKYQTIPTFLLFELFKGRRKTEPIPKDGTVHPGLIGKTGYAVMEMTPGYYWGRVRVDGVEYRAICDTSQLRKIQMNSRVVVKRIDMDRLRVIACNS